MKFVTPLTFALMALLGLASTAHVPAHTDSSVSEVCYMQFRDHYACIVPEVFLGVLAGTQANVATETSTCYTAALDAKNNMEKLLWTYSEPTAWDQFNVVLILSQTAFSSCNFDSLLKQLDNRMSNFDFTMGLLSNVITQIAGGLVQQDF